MHECFNNVIELIETGHLTLSFKVNGVSIKIKNPNLDVIEWVDDFCDPENNIEKLIVLCIKCITSISGIDTKDLFFEIYDVLLNSSTFPILYKMKVYADYLMVTATRTSKYLESFCYTEESRYMWKSWKAKNKFSNFRFDSLNQIQNSWVIWNEAEDHRLESNSEWEKAFFIASATNPKGVETVSKKWKTQESLEEERRREFVEKAKKGEFEQSPSSTPRRNFNKHKSVEELREEMRKWVLGEEDEHDNIVTEYKNEIQRTVEEMQRRSEEIKLRNKRKKEDIERTVTGVSLIGFTEEQIRSRVKPIETTSFVEDVNKNIIDNFIMKPIDKGNLFVDGIEVKGEYKEDSLMDRISNRKPTME